jgi:hypothetical protein
MRLKYFSMVLAAGLMLAGVVAFSDAGDAARGRGGGHGGGGHGGGGHGGGGHAHMSFRSFRGSHISHGSSHRFHVSRTGGTRLHTSVSHNKGYFAARSTTKTNSRLTGNQKNLKSFASNKSRQQASLTKHNAFFNKSFAGKGNSWRGRYGRWYGHRWFGAAFWPYALGDYFSYALWPYDYYDTFWGYGPDAIFDGAFWPYGEIAYDGYGSYGGGIYGPSGRTSVPSASAVAETCAGFAPGVGDLPIQQLEKIIDATGDQQGAFDDLKAAAAKASSILQQSCPSEPPLTPVARLDAMQHRLQAMEEADEVVRRPLVRLYGLLTGEQKQRLNAMAQANGGRSKNARQTNIGELCTSQAGFANVPAGQIESSVALDGTQKQKLQRLQAASAKAAESLKSSCPSFIPDSVDGRLDAAQQRIAALIQAVDTVRPAVQDFYASLTDEQKAALSLQPSQRSASNRG